MIHTQLVQTGQQMVLGETRSGSSGAGRSIPRLRRASLISFGTGFVLLIPFVAISMNDVRGGTASFLFTAATILGSGGIATAAITLAWSFIHSRLPEREPSRYTLVAVLVVITILIGIVLTFVVLGSVLLSYPIWHSEPLNWV